MPFALIGLISLGEYLAWTLIGLLLGWVGHACFWTASLNYLYGCPLPKSFLKPYRQFCGVVILGFPLITWVALDEPLRSIAQAYFFACLAFGLFVFPVITVGRLLRPKPSAILNERTETVDYWRQLGPAAVGDGKYRHVARLPFNDVFKVDFTDLTLTVPNLPPAWGGLRILLLSDLHFCGTPSRAFFEAVLDKLAVEPTDLVLLAGDYLDTDTHYDWIAPLLGRLSATEGRYAILGNHDRYHGAERIRKELSDAGYTVLRNGWREATVRGVRCVLVGHEGPWFRPGPDLSDAPPDLFRLCLSHTPDNFYWGRRNRVGLMVCGHVHGGQVRVPVIGSIFVPSVYGRRFDMGVFEGGGTVMVVGRGLSGKEPLRFRCKPQVIRLTLTPVRSVS
ncbi:MAG TPA: metallophosphoesterase [Fimbriiglobus sp.]|nr:metallophosphoesterase [Fimbriiglobus sp.]